MSWERRRVAIVEERPELGGIHIVGWINERDCGCQARRGMRLDKNEQTFTVTPCDSHRDETKRAVFVIGHMPPSDREVFALYEELFERELDDAVAA